MKNKYDTPLMDNQKRNTKLETKYRNEKPIKKANMKNKSDARNLTKNIKI